MYLFAVKNGAVLAGKSVIKAAKAVAKKVEEVVVMAADALRSNSGFQSDIKAAMNSF